MAKRIALITGGMGGLGESVSTKMHHAGFQVVVTHSPGNKSAAQWVADQKGKGCEFAAYGVDVADYDSCRECVAKVQAEVGPVDILVNNAGITRDMTFKKMTKADWDMVIHTNLDSAFNMTKQVCDGMVERGWGRIINVSSVNGSKGAFGQTNYAAAKAGMHGFTKSLAYEVARKGVTVNTISPGYRRVFLDEGPLLVSPLEKVRHVAPAYVSSLIDSNPGDSPAIPPALPEPLSRAEREILRLLTRGLTNQEIADKMGTTVGTTKWHMNQIFGKLQVHNRTTAIAKARDLRLL